MYRTGHWPNLSLGRSIPRSKCTFTEVIIFEDQRAGGMTGGKGASHEVDNLSLIPLEHMVEGKN